MWWAFCINNKLLHLTNDQKNMNESKQAEAISAKNWVRRHPVWSVVIGFFAVGFIVSAVNGTPADTTSVPAQAQPQVTNTPSQNTHNDKVALGGEGTVNYHSNASDCSDTTLVANDEETENGIVRASIANDTYGMAEFVTDGKAFLVPNCSKVKVIDTGVGTRRIRIEDGKQAGMAGWVPMEFVKSL
jgi:hypothetical protein